MTNEMMRPCTLWGYTFDAMSVTQVLSTEIYIVVCLEDNTTFTSPFYDECFIQSQRYLQEAITTIADALNAPVLATEVVLAGLPKDANAVLIDTIGIPHSLNWVSRAVIGDGWAWGDDYDVMPHHRIQAFRCSKTAEYLRQFTLEGKLIKQKEINE